AQSSLTVPVRVRHKSSPAYRAAHPDRLFAADLGCGTTFTGCAAVPQIKVKWSWICGDDRRWHGLNAELEYQCVNTNCWELIQELMQSALDSQVECLKNAAKRGVISVDDLKDCAGELKGLACDVVNTLAVCMGITDACALALLKAACVVATKDVGGAGGAGAGLASCICPKISLPSLSSPPPGEPPPVPYYETRNNISAPGNISSPIQPIVFWDYDGADCDPGLHPLSAASKLKASATTQPGGVCARVRIRLDQEVALTRSAFLGTLEIDNQSTDTPLTSVRVTMDIRTENGTNANDRFFIQTPDLSVLTAVDGSGLLAPASTGTAKFTFIPTHEAAPDAPKIYRFGGTLSYVAGTEVVEVPLAPQTLTVYPDPILHLDYFLTRDVFSDDPFTEVVEPSEPFALGLLVRNTGKGKAVNFRITSAQPKIVENQKGLLIDFKIIGTQVSTQQVTPSLTMRLGDIDAGRAQVAAFYMTASLQGKFIEYNADFKHVDSLGGDKTSLIDDVTLHELIHVVRADQAGADAAMDFLANDLQDPDHLPDTLYFSDGSMAPVDLATSATVDAPASLNHLVVQLTTAMPTGWAYLQMLDPGPNYRLYRVVRSDGREILVGTNVWTTDRSFPESAAGPIAENLLHLLDYNST
ncbi:MAG TPA: hypothetical protein VNZ22_00300, partial [Bacillota bacterium]|nr:hypothetical protein [Bacillota bacterium]